MASLREADPARPVAVWGAATKGVLFCHHVMRQAPDVGRRIACAVDVNPMKQGRFLPSTRLPIHGPDGFAAMARGDEIVLVMNGNYRDEIAALLAARGLGRVELRAF